MKFTNTAPKYAEKIRKASTPDKAKWLGRSRKFPIVADWDNISYNVMKQGLYAKFTQHKHLKKVLLKTGDKILVENAPYDYIWGCGKKGYGKNKLGLALMEIRTILKNNL